MRRALIRVNNCHARASEFGQLDLEIHVVTATDAMLEESPSIRLSLSTRKGDIDEHHGEMA